jgi:hypothetical protein
MEGRGVHVDRIVYQDDAGLMQLAYRRRFRSLLDHNPTHLPIWFNRRSIGDATFSFFIPYEPERLA